MDLPPVPKALEHVLEWYHELGSRRQNTMAGPQAISFSEISAWANLTGRTIMPFEVELICRLDNVFRYHSAERAAAESRQREEKSRASSNKGKK